MPLTNLRHSHYTAGWEWVSLRHRTAERRRRQNACVWQTWQGCYLRVLSWSSFNIIVSVFLHRDVIKGMWSLAKRFLKQNYCHARHTRFTVFFPLPPCCVNSLLFQQITTFANDLTSGKYCWQVWRVHFRSQLKYFSWRGILANKYCMYFISWTLLSSPRTRHWFS